MFASTEYELVDFGQGRKLERFGHYLVDRPAPAAANVVQEQPKTVWQRAARFDRVSGDRGVWDTSNVTLPERWQIRHSRFVLELKATPAGQLGVFPEQAANWDWLAEQISAADHRVKLLNLFAYTGASSLAAAAAGAEVTHVDAAQNTVAWARRNAELSSLGRAPIRWIADDGPAFVRRELKRGRQYDWIVLDPPSYGHGTKGKTWKLVDDLGSLLADCLQLCSQEPGGLLLTCHTPGFGPGELGDILTSLSGHRDVASGSLLLQTPGGRTLTSGAQATFVRNPP